MGTAPTGRRTHRALRQLVDDPSARPEEFPTKEAQRTERERLHRLIERLVTWENTRDETLLADAHAEILESTNGNPPPPLGVGSWVAERLPHARIKGSTNAGIDAMPSV